MTILSLSNKPLFDFIIWVFMVQGGVSLKGLSKDYRFTEVLDNINLEIFPGEVFGYIGPNGAGKTTTLKCIIGLIDDYEGEITIDGNLVNKGHRFNSIGYMPQNPHFTSWRNVHRVLRIFGRLNGMGGSELEQRIDEVLHLLGIEQFKTTNVSKLSGGTLQKLGMAQAILHKPSLLVLDEPMASLDPESRKVARNIIHDLRNQGVTVIFSSHILSDVQDIADRVGIIQNGRMVHVGHMREIKKEMTTTGLVDVELSINPVIDFNQVPGISAVDSHGHGSFRFKLQEGADMDNVIDELIWKIINSGGSIRSVIPVTHSLEDIYLRYLAGGKP